MEELKRRGELIVQEKDDYGLARVLAVDMKRRECLHNMVWRRN